MKKYIMILILLTFLKNTYTQEKNQEYIEFINGEHLSSVDYVFQLFEKYRIVILCERFHPETTQWDLILKIVSDPRFKEVGLMYTEYGSRNFNGQLNDFLSKKYEQERDSVLLTEIYKNFSFYPLWENRNFYDFLNNLNQVNNNLEKPITLRFTDVNFNWDSIQTKEDFEYFQQTSLRNRDKTMADFVIYDLDNNYDNTQKALIIQNYRHAFINIYPKPNKDYKEINFGRYMKERYSDSLASVYINSLAIRLSLPLKWIPVHKGEWDRLFINNSLNDIGFNFETSPFGQASFDYYPFRNKLTYSDFFTGMIYYKTPLEFKFEMGFPEFFDESFTDEYIRRARIFGNKEKKIEKNLHSFVSEIRVESVYDDKSIKIKKIE